MDALSPFLEYDWKQSKICMNNYKDIAIFLILYGADIAQCTFTLTENDIDYILDTSIISDSN